MGPRSGEDRLPTLTALLLFEALDTAYAYMGDPSSFAGDDWGGRDFGGGDF